MRALSFVSAVPLILLLECAACFIFFHARSLGDGRRAEGGGLRASSQFSACEMRDDWLTPVHSLTPVEVTEGVV